jgi:anaerobic magnesium-protoporphyrin IX monomethyl ester cyclase
MNRTNATKVTLVYPYFHPPKDNSIFRFPPLGLGYIAAYLKQHNIPVNVVDCTFLSQEEALRTIRQSKPDIIGIQSMFSIRDKSLELARLLRKDCEMLAAGGPLPTSNPEWFLPPFDVVVFGEGEQTMFELVRHVESKTDLSSVKGIAYLEKDTGRISFTSSRNTIKNLDIIPFPLRELFDNGSYKNYYAKKFGYTTTSLITSRGCPFNCDFCSRPIFGNDYRARTVTSIADEVKTIRDLGYDRAWFADDCFTLNRKRLMNICDELIRRHIKIGWECLSRVDTVDSAVAAKMKQAGCIRVYFGIESGNDSILALMNKQVTVKQAAKAVHMFRKAEIEVGAFFIVGYPGENEKTILDTVKFASSLPLNYLSFTLPYPIPGTPLFERIKNEITLNEWEEPRNSTLVKHKLLFRSPFSEAKLKVAILKGMTQHKLRRYLGNHVYRLVGTPFERTTDILYKLLR